MIIHNKICSICDNPFKTKYKNKNYCSFNCKQESRRKRSRTIVQHKWLQIKERKQNGTYKIKPCEICGYNRTIDIHHDGNEIAILCPNCHALISRNIRTLKQLIKERDVRKL